jgi:hypothetical protein
MCQSKIGAKASPTREKLHFVGFKFKIPDLNSFFKLLVASALIFKFKNSRLAQQFKFKV